jgi:hypothetical protein
MHPAQPIEYLLRGYILDRAGVHDRYIGIVNPFGYHYAV